MSSGLASLHKILKDEKRRKIILLLNERGNLSYTDLMKSLEVDNTGRFNYHLKILNELVEKNSDGKYSLTEKGMLASRLLREFPEENEKLRMNCLRQRIYIGLVLQVIYVVTIVTLYFLTIIDIIWVIRGIGFLIVFIIGNYLIYRTQGTRLKPGSKEDVASMKIVYTAGGVGLSLGIAFFGVLISSRIISDLSGKPYLHLIASNEWFFFLSLIIAPTIGGFIGYWLGKRKGFKRFELRIRGYRL